MRYVFLFSMILSGTVFAQKNISGFVKDAESGEPLTGVHIVLAGTASGVHSGGDGRFLLKGIKNNHVILKFSRVGYQARIDTLSTDMKEHVIEMRKEIYVTSTIEVLSLRSGTTAPYSVTDVSRQDIAKTNLGQDLPFLLNQTPSVVVTSDAGAGVGYTGIRIRGTDVTRINVTLNGIPVNDAESQGTFFVNFPDLASSLSSIQVNRGVGSSTNGAGAFGASINMSTSDYTEKPYAEISNSYGSFNTWKHTIRAGTGLLGGHFTLDARLSKISSDGYIDRAGSDLKSFYVSGAYYGKKGTTIRANIISGREKTYQAWYGVSREIMDTNRTYNVSGTEKPGEPYQNETDNYGQEYYQLFLNQKAGKHLMINVGAFLTRGKGYYEQYKAGQSYQNYGLQPMVNGTDTTFETDLIRQLWLDNYFYGTVYSVQFTKKRIELTAGGAYSAYDGRHYGKVLWASNGGIPENYEWYRHSAFKNDFSIYTKLNWQVIDNLFLYGDIQYRYVRYKINGFRNNPGITTDLEYNFFNPKAGLKYLINREDRVYTSFAVANKEPNRDDFEAGAANTPKPESLYNLEAGYERVSDKYSFSANIYYMHYRNQLVLTGRINDVGAYTRTNIPESYRLGLELQGGVKFLKILTFTANLTLSRNRVMNFTEYIDNYDTGGQDEVQYKETDIAFSPALISSGTLTIEPVKRFCIDVCGKYVSRQNLDNTSRKERSLDGFFVPDIRLRYTFSWKFFRQIGINVMLNNISNSRYAPNGYNYSYISGGELVNGNYYYPQARFNFMTGLTIGF